VQEHFKSQGKLVTAILILATPVDGKGHPIHINALKNELGRVLPQEHYVVAYVFLTTQTYDRNHSTLDPKLAVIAFASKV